MFVVRKLNPFFWLLQKPKCNIISRSISGGFSGNSELHSSLLSQKTGKFHIYCIDDKGERSEHPVLWAADVNYAARNSVHCPQCPVLWNFCSFLLSTLAAREIPSHAFHIPKTALYNSFGLTIRDLRFQHPNMIFVRNQKLIMRFQDLKLLVCPDAILLIDPPFGTDAEDDSNSKMFWQSLPTLITQPVLYTSNLPLEYRALEAIFTHVMCEFTQSISKLQPEINELLSNLTDPTTLIVDRSLVHVLLKNSTRLNRFSTQLTEFCNALEEILEHEETIRKYCISCSDVEDGEGSRSNFDAYVFCPIEEAKDADCDSTKSFEIRFPGHLQHKFKINLQDEMEDLIDSYLRDAEEIGYIVKELKEAIDNSTTAILINLDSYRNSILRFELELTIGMFSFGLFGLIGMAFGMNLESSFEENPFAFWCAAGLMFGGSGIVWAYLLRVSRRPLPQNSELLKKILSKDKMDKPPPSGSPPGSAPGSNVDSTESKLVKARKKFAKFFDETTSSSAENVQINAATQFMPENVANSVSEQTKVFGKRNSFGTKRSLSAVRMKSLISEDNGVSKMLREDFQKR